MMKWLVLFLPFFGAAQGVRLNQYDKFIKKHRVEMEPVNLVSSPAAGLTVTFSSTASDLFVQVSGWGWGATTIDDGNELHFLFANDSSVTATAAGLQTFEPGLERNTYRHRYRIGGDEVELLARLDLAALRKFSFKESSDIKIPKEAKAKLQRSATLFLAEMRKGLVARTRKQIHPKDVLNVVGDSVTFCSTVYTARYTETTEGKLTVLELQSDFSHPVVHAVIAEEDRARFGGAPEKDFANKDVCLTGVVTLRNNVPTIVLQNSAQLVLAGKAAPPTPR